MKCSLTWSEPGNRGEDTIGVAGEKENVFGVSAERRLCNLSDVINGVTYTRVFCPGAIRIIDFKGSLLENDVLQQRSLFDCLKNIGFLFFTQINDFGITSSLKIENHVVRRPAVLVVADEFTVRI